jgi:glycosyltransferase 2 family protein
MSMKKFAVIALKLAITVGVLGWLVVKVEPRMVIETSRMVHPAMLTVALVLTAIQPLIATLRWHLILRYLDTPISFAQCLRVSWMGVFASSLLPGGVAGDGVRMWVLTRAGARPSKCINSVLLDRAGALIGLLLLVAATVPFVDDRVAVASVRYGLVALIVGGIAAALAVGLGMRLPAAWSRFRAASAFYNLSADLWAVCLPLWRPIVLASMSAFAIACNSLTTLFLLHCFGAQAGLVDTMVLAPLVILVTTLPVSFGGWGLREGAMVSLFGMIGVEPALSLSVSILVGLLSTAVSLPGGLFFLQWRRFNNSVSQAGWSLRRFMRSRKVIGDNV